jgi:drug/metabolite transporter (DMT)-like permease
VIVASFSQIILKKGALKKHTSVLKEYLNSQVIIGYSMMIISTFLTILAFRGLDFKNGPIIESTGYIFVMILSSLFLMEKITLKKLIGNILILIGILIFYF